MSTGYRTSRCPTSARGRGSTSTRTPAGCSPAVLAAIERSTREASRVYPAYDARHRSACAARFGVTPTRCCSPTASTRASSRWRSRWLPTRTGTAPRPSSSSRPTTCTAPSRGLAGARVVAVAAPGRTCASTSTRVLAAITPATRVVFLSNPNNPTGAVLPAGVVAALAAALPPGGARVRRRGVRGLRRRTRSIRDIARHPNLVVGRTFAKAYGLAGLRIGCVVAQAAGIRRLRGAIAPFSVNVFAAARSRRRSTIAAYLEWYLEPGAGVARGCSTTPARASA